MNRNLVRTLLCVGAVGLLALFATACGSSDDDTTSGSTEAELLSFTVTDAGCDPIDAEAAAGPITFEAENGGTDQVNELEILDGETVLGEVANIAAEGDSGTMSLTLEQGEYTILCPGGDGDPGTLTVSGELQTENSPAVEEAVETYRAYLEENTAELVEATEPFVAAVVAGNIAEANSLYPAARIPYERIEPVAESFGSLDPRIDARENDVPPSEFEGFHRLEKALWEEESLKGMAPVAEQLLADVEELAEKVKTVELQAVQIANGANELLAEVSASKITGEEERYSHIDLVDFEANVEGSEAAFEAVKPLLDESDPDLAGEIEADFKMVFNSLEPYRTADGFVPYTDLTEADTKKLAVAIDTLAEKLSLVPAEIAGAEHE
jgi:iron uptake system component EfeO